MPGYEIIRDMKFLLTKKEKGMDRQIVKQKDPVLDADYRDFGRIYDLFANQARFQTGLATVSAALWQNYLTITNQRNLQPYQAVREIPPGNLFTRCLGMLALQNGFTYQQGLSAETDFNTTPIGVTLIAGDPFIGALIRGKLFWKDAISADHGEHSHSFQWLVAASELTGSTTTPIADLYVRTVDYWIMKRDTGGINLWQFLVDCFPAVGGGARDPDVRLVTDTYRSPQNVTRHLLGTGHAPIADHFVSAYLFGRYKKRGWVKGVAGTPQAPLFNLAQIGVNPSEKAGEGWVQGVQNPARLTRKKVTPRDISERNLTEVSFHNEPGYLFMGS